MNVGALFKGEARVVTFQIRRQSETLGAKVWRSPLSIMTPIMNMNLIAQF